MAINEGKGGKLKLGSFEIDMIDKIGQGSFGVVYRGKHTLKGYPVAAKQCDLKSDKAGSVAMVEIKHFQYLQNHPHIVKLQDFHYKDKAFWMIMEFCDAGDLEHYFKEKKPLKPLLNEQLNIMYQCASAVAYMHGQRNTVVHRDIKPGNLLLKRVGQEAIVKVTDFGLSKIVEAPDPAKTLLFTTKAGTPGFMAPEFFLSLKYEKSVDVFALGLVFLAMINFKPGDSHLAPVSGTVLIPIGAQMAQFGQMNMPLPDFVTDKDGESKELKSIKALIRSMIKYYPKERCSMSEVEEMIRDLGGTSSQKIPTIPQSEAPQHRPLDRPAEGPDEEEMAAGSITMNRYREPEGSESDDEDDESADNADRHDDGTSVRSSSEEGDVGFRVMKRALEQALKDRLDVSDEVLEGMRDLPFKELLAQCIRPDKAVDQFEPGDQVIILDDKQRVEELQDGYGGWNNAMTKYLGGFGIVREKRHHVIKVIHDDGVSLHYNPKVLIKTGEKPYKLSQLKTFDVDDERVMAIKARFRRYDVVTLPEDEDLVKCLQEGHGGWNPKMKKALDVKGMVNRVDGDGDVFVEFIHGDDWTVNPELLIKVDMSDGVIEAGDFVVVSDDKSFARKLQKHLGVWEDGMDEKLGHSGVVRAVSKRTITVDSGRRSFKWHPSLIKLVAKGEEMMQAILKKNLML